MRVYELAKEFNLSSKDFRNLIERELGLKYNSHMESMTPEEVKKVRELMNRNSKKNVKKPEKKDIKKSVQDKKSQEKSNFNKRSSSQSKVDSRQKPMQDKNRDFKDFKDKKPFDKDFKDRKSFDKDFKDKKPFDKKKNVAMKSDDEILFVPTKRENEDSYLRHQKKKTKTDVGESTDFSKKAKGKKYIGDEIEEIIAIKKNPKKKKNKAAKAEKVAVEQVQEDITDAIIEIPNEITVGDFAKAIHQNSMSVITELIKMGIMASLNESITFETAEKIADKFGILITEPEETDVDELFALLDFDDPKNSLVGRPPVVTVMGHVDHGKTSLLDAIRSTQVTRGEAGGITQHIGASTIDFEGRHITFLDTPGHEAFTQMRARGAKATDIAILVVAADDGVMPQTVEAINHAKAAKVPVIVAINKMDKYGADPNRVMQELAEQGLMPEEWGGDTVMIPVSAKSGMGVDDLLQMILMVAEMEELKANPKRNAVGIIIESQLEKGRGATASILVQKGTLYDTDYIVSGQVSGHIRAMFDSHGNKVKSAGPSIPVKIIGLSDLPEAGDHIYAVNDEKTARDFAEKAQERAKNERLNSTTHVSLDDLAMQISEAGLKELNIIVKTDVKGTIDALAGSLEKLGNEEVKVNIIHGAVGGISESDVMLATASNAIIIGFNVRPNQGAISLAERDEIEMRTYRVIYEAIEDIQKAIKGMLAPKFEEEVLGRAEIRNTFKIPNAGTIGGIYVTSGKIVRNASIRLLRNDIVIHEGKISSLKRFKDDAKEIATNYEGGLGIENYNDIKIGDQVECFHEVEVKRD